MKHYNIRITGLVQGVGFRYSARHTARFYGIKGFVRNDPDGSVYIEAEGDDESLNQFIIWCRQGPGHAWVENIITEESGIRGFSGFEVKF